jgi:tRNA pseudouridine38-40 synthase
MRVALKFGYDGSRFWGYQRQPDVRTVEGDIITALRKTRIIRDLNESNFLSASRTDRKVSAIGNVLALDTDFRLKEIIRAMNSKLEDIYFWGIAEVEDGFVPRHADQRWYRYHLPGHMDVDLLKEASLLFKGEHDFKGFCRKSERSTVRIVDSIAVKKGSPFIFFDIKAQSFLWNMVRRIVSAVVKYADGEITKKEVKDALAGKGKDLGLVAAQPLILMDVSYDFEFNVQKTAVPSPFFEKFNGVRVQKELYQGLQERIG